MEIFKFMDLGDGMAAVAAPMGEQCYLVQGKEKALIIDTGMGIGSLREYMRRFTELDFLVINTHGHPDHAGGNGEFEEVYMHSADREIYKNMCTVEFRMGDVRNLRKEMEDAYREVMLPYRENIRFLDDMREIDLGGRILELLHIPGHTAGSICLFDRRSKTLFAGDSLNEQTWLHLDMSLPVSDYRESLFRIKNRGWDIRKIQTGHTGAAAPPDRLDQMIACAGQILDGETRDRVMDTFAGKGLWHPYGDAGILYRLPESNI